MNVKQYDGSELISAVAKELKSMPEFNAPEWTMFVKTGVNRVDRQLKQTGGKPELLQFFVKLLY